MPSSDNEIRLILELVRDTNTKIDKLFSRVDKRDEVCAAKQVEFEQIEDRVTLLEKRPQKFYKIAVTFVCILASIATVWEVFFK